MMRTELMIMLVVIAQVAVIGCQTLDAVRERFDSKTAEVIAPATPDAVQPETEPEHPPVVELVKVYVPGPDSITITIPARMKPTKMLMGTLNSHIELYGPDSNPSRDAYGNYVYILKGGGAEWAAKASRADPKGYASVMVFCKLEERQTDWDNYNNVGYRIIDPTQSYDESARLAPGTDH